jgi:hypothetical protein
MSQVMDHVRELADVIGPRPACTDAEARAADYIEGVFAQRGLETERQEFDSPRTTAWAFTVYHLLTIGAAVLSIWFGLPALVIAVLAAALLMLDFAARFTIAPFLGKGPSQNIIARHVPRQRRGERLKRVVIVAHYDSAKAGIATSPGMVRNAPLLLLLTKVFTLLTPFVIFVSVLPFAAEWKPWTGYAACAAAAFLLVPLVLNLQRELLGHATDGANDNATGIAALFGVMEATVPEPDELQLRDRSYRRHAELDYEPEAEPEEQLLAYRPVGEVTEQRLPLDGFGDVDWETGKLEPVRPSMPAPAAPAPSAPASATPAPSISDDWSEAAGVGGLFDEPEPVARPVETPAWQRPATPKPSPVPVDWSAKPKRMQLEDEQSEGQEELPLDLPEVRSEAPERRADEAEDRHAHGISAWLGIGKGFDVRKAGKRIGSWENLDHDDDDDEFGFKGGAAGEMPDVDAPEVAALIRRRVTESVDRALVEKEIWFVATGADEAGGWGMRALLDAYGDDLDDALFINIDSVGTGTVSFVTEEGAARSYHSDRRLVAQARRTVRENDLAIKPHSYKGFSTSATPALARRFKAMTVMAFDINGRVPNQHWHSDVTDNVVPSTIEQATTFVTALLRDL